MIQTIKVYNKDIFPTPRWIDIAHVNDMGKDYCDDDYIYFYTEFDNVYEKGDIIQLDEECVIVEVRE